MIRIAASVLAADFARLGEEVAALDGAKADLIHCDVMDGSFVPSISFGADFIAAVSRSSRVPLDVHLMVRDPVSQFGFLEGLRPQIISFHLEAVDDPTAVAREIRSIGALAGVAIKPATPGGRLVELLPHIDVALVMTVEPGLGGQHFMGEMIPKISEIATAIRAGGLSTMLEVDGGIDVETIRAAAAAGADTFVAGTAVFGHRAGLGAAVDALRVNARAAVRH